MRSDATSPRTPSAPACIPERILLEREVDLGGTAHRAGLLRALGRRQGTAGGAAGAGLGLRTELRQRGLSLKYVKNILAGSFKAMLRDARLIDRVLAADPFEGVTWPRVEVPEADPFAPDERQRILAWFRDRRFGFSAG